MCIRDRSRKVHNWSSARDSPRRKKSIHIRAAVAPNCSVPRANGPDANGQWDAFPTRCVGLNRCYSTKGPFNFQPRSIKRQLRRWQAFRLTLTTRAHCRRLKLAHTSPHPADFNPLPQLARALASNMRFVRGEIDNRGLVIAAHAATQHKSHAFIDGCGDVLRISQHSLVVW